MSYSLLKYFSPINGKRSSNDETLPSPTGTLSRLMPSTAISTANSSVKKEMKRSARSPYLNLTPAQRYQVGRRAAEHGVTSTIRYYAQKFPDLALKEASVRRLKNIYQASLKLGNAPVTDKQNSQGSSDVKEFPPKKTGRPLLLGEELDQQVRHYLAELRTLGGVVNTRVAIAVGIGIVTSKDATLLAKYGGNIVLTKHWAKYLLQRMGMVKRRGSTKAKVNVKNFEELKELFLSDVKSVIEMDEIPPAMVINWDHTAINYVPVSSWTMEKEGSKKVEIVAKDDKRQITAVFGCSMAGDFLPVQLLYQGKTTRSLPHFQFPEDWHVMSTPNHWANEDTTKLYIEKIIFPYLRKKREELRLSSEHPALLLFDNFKAQCTETILKYLDSNNINVVLVPPNCTDQLQPLDLSVNRSAKEFLRNEFQEWYAQQVCAQLQGKVDKKPVDLRLSIVKPLGAKWMVNFYNYIQTKPDVVKNGFREAGIL